ncbi:MAG: hypothetical protein K1X78_13880 [Verrucomicrobiaceae bacterium]|nr:hypothetical protein [Verrucomicrobiaceae bacterium]
MAPAEAPTTRGTPVRQISVFMHNRVGALMSLVKMLHDSRIEVLGLSVQESTELTIARFVVSDPDTVETLFMEKGIPFDSTCVLTVVELRPLEGTLVHCLAALLAAEINIHVSYPLLARPGNYPLLALYLDEPDLAGEALSNAGFRVLLQEDLSR